MEIVVVLHNIRSLLNVGAIFRSCESFGVKQIWLSGYSPNPKAGLPHVRQKMAEKLHKTALGTEKLVNYTYATDVVKITTSLRKRGFRIVGLEQAEHSIRLADYRASHAKIALLLGEETAGLTPELIALCDEIIEIPMFGRKESLNVAVAAGIALYHLATTQSAS
jgi:tRNA G18 (ribose-2'-O)-methylase SpoU